MKTTKLFLTLGLIFITSLSACSPTNKSNEITNKEFINQTFLDLKKGEPNPLVMTASDHYSNGGVFGCVWSKNNIYYDENGMNFCLYKEADKYYGAEMKTLGVDGMFQYGYFSTKMKPSNVTGTASTFFLYRSNPHDEIDIEFLGKDTTKVQFNYFHNGVGGNEYMYDLGFDASEEYHTYGFYWDLSKIIWYVDEQPVYQRESNIPSNSMSIFMNLWNGKPSNNGIMAWMGKIAENDLPAISSYQYVNYADIYGKGRPAIENEDNTFNEDYVVSLYDLGFTSNYNYTVTKQDDRYDVSFTQKEGGYQYLAPSNYAALTFGKPKYASITVKNLSDFTYDFCLSYYDSDNQYVALDGEVVSENNTSYLRKKGSTCLYYSLGPNDKATFKSLIKEDVTKFSKMNIMCAPNSNTTGAFSIYDWFVYDVDPVNQEDEPELNMISMMDVEFYGDYEVSKTDDVYNVNFAQIVGGLKDTKVKDIAELTFNKPQYSVIKMKNLSNFSYYFTLTFREQNKSYMSTGGVCVSSQNGSSSYYKHGSTAEYFTFGAEDEVEFKIILNESASVFSLIEIIISPNASEALEGSFQILDWYIATK